MGLETDPGFVRECRAACCRFGPRVAVYRMSPERKEYRIRFEEVTQKAREIVRQDGSHVPVLIVEGSKNLIVGQLRDMPDTHGERLELMRFLGQLAAKSGKVGELQQVFFISEGWISMASEDKPPQNPPSGDPNRKEVLIVSGLEVQARRRMLKLFEMVRGPNQQVIDLPEISPPEGREGEVEIPLLDAFAQGFRLAFQASVN
jgi:hypothetical protein